MYRRNQYGPKKHHQDQTYKFNEIILLSCTIYTKELNWSSKNYLVSTPFTTGFNNRQHHDNGAPINIFEMTLFVFIIEQFPIW